MFQLEGLIEEALDLLWKASRLMRDKQAQDVLEAKAIVKTLANHPLAITQAGSYIQTQKIRVDQFMAHYERKKEKILKHTPQLSQYRRRLSDEAEKETSLNVFTTWELSFQQFLQSTSSGQEKADLLTLFAFFNYNGISEDIRKSLDGIPTQQLLSKVLRSITTKPVCCTFTYRG